MSALLTHSVTDLHSIQEWFALTSHDLFQAKREQPDEMARVQLHVAAQSAHRLAAEIERFVTLHRQLQRDGLIEE